MFSLRKDFPILKRTACAAGIEPTIESCLDEGKTIVRTEVDSFLCLGRRSASKIGAT